MKTKAERANKRAKEWYLINKERKKLYDIEYNKKNRKKRNRQCLSWSKLNSEKRKEIRKASYYKNKSRAFVSAAARRARLLNAYPKWLTKDQKRELFEIYKNRPQGYHVDHIVPLKGKNVCGLHVPWNLQYLLARDNFLKGNKSA